MTVLLVDDDDYFRETLKDLLAAEGADVTTAANGLEALRELRQRAVDVVVLDMAMPVMNGEAFLAAKQNSSDIAAIPTVVVSADPTAARLTQIGVASVLHKPVDLDTLMAELVNVT